MLVIFDNNSIQRIAKLFCRGQSLIFLLYAIEIPTKDIVRKTLDFALTAIFSSVVPSTKSLLSSKRNGHCAERGFRENSTSAFARNACSQKLNQEPKAERDAVKRVLPR